MSFIATGHAQIYPGQSINSADYYTAFWKQNLDSLLTIHPIHHHDVKKSPNKKPHKISQSEIEGLLKQLPTNFPLQYNERVLEILNFYLEQPRNTAVAFAYHKAMKAEIESQLQTAALPTQLSYLPLALSAMNNLAQNKNGARGAWLINYSAARKEGLVIDSYVDERLNLQKGSMAAFAELKQLYQLYQDWELTLGAYSCGPSNINKSIRRLNNQNSYYVLYPNLPDFGRDIVPALTAATLLGEFADEFNFKIPSTKFSTNLDTVEVSKRLHFKQLEAVLHISMDSLRVLNPEYKYDIVPAINRVFTIYLPNGYLMAFNALEDSIYHFQDSLLFDLKKPVILPPPSKERHYAKYEPEAVPSGSAIVYYHIKSGDNLGYVASWYDVKLSEIEDWNNIYDPRRIQIGKKIKIYVPKNKLSYYQKIDGMSNAEKRNLDGKSASNSTSSSSSVATESKPASTNTEALGDNWFYHTVKSGESPYNIAQKYPGVSADDIVRWNNISDPRSISVGQKLKIKKQ
jgi:membrane-bound lytic murein transglycosylase D